MKKCNISFNITRLLYVVHASLIAVSGTHVRLPLGWRSERAVTSLDLVLIPAVGGRRGVSVAVRMKGEG